MAENTYDLKGGRRETAFFCMEVYGGRFGPCPKRIVDDTAFENWLKGKCQDNGIFVNI